MRPRPTTRVLAGVLLTGLALAFQPACGQTKTEQAPALVAPAPATASGSRPASEKAKNANHAVIFVDFDGKELFPKTAYLWINDTVPPEPAAKFPREVWWLSTEQGMEITFKAGNPQVVPPDKIDCKKWAKLYRCRWVIGKKEFEKGTYTYELKVGGLTIDPEVEIDR